MFHDICRVRAILDRCSLESYGFIDREPGLGAKYSGWCTKTFGARVARIMPESLAGKIEEKARDLIWPYEPISFGDAAYDPSNVFKVLKAADQVHRNSLFSIFGEGAVGSAGISFASTLNPLVGIVAVLGELSANYLLLLKCSYELQKAFCLTPTLELTTSAFGIATSSTREERLNAFAHAEKTMLHGMFARRLNTHRDPEFVAKVKHSAVRLVTNAVQKLSPTEAADTAAEQSARALLQASFRSFCQKHPQLWAAIAPVGGALFGGTWAAWSARNMMLTNYHLSRLRYIEIVKIHI